MKQKMFRGQETQDLQMRALMNVKMREEEETAHHAQRRRRTKIRGPLGWRWGVFVNCAITTACEK